jgi:aspartate aminotransferase-like enzyme/N-acyl-L-homoserine lactone synthetase
MMSTVGGGPGMVQIGPYVFKRAETPHEFEQVHRLNYKTFVREIPQHADHGGDQLVDKFHHKNIYIIVLRQERVVGMVSAHGEPPFSVADRLSDPGELERAGTRPVEVRLLAIEPAERNSSLIFIGLLWSVYEYARVNGYTHMVISGVEERADLYERIGFIPLGPAVPSGKAKFIPMALKIGQLPIKMERVKQRWESQIPSRSSLTEDDRVCLLPGPVTISPAVRAAFHQPPSYHRGPEFIRRFVRVRRLLGQLVGGRDVAILNGSGTLANETIAATLAADPGRGRGVLLVNGEFGHRLARQATRFGLQPRILTWPWGRPWDLNQIDQTLAEEPEGSWVWGVHQESSTGVLNDLRGLVRLGRRRGIRVCADCISSLGAVALDLREVYLASGASGKSLGAIAGASILFADRSALAAINPERIPSYFDLRAALDSDGPCYTFPSATLFALEAALREYLTPAKAQLAYQRYHVLGVYVREQLRQLGLEPLAEDVWASPVVTTFTPPGEDTSESFVDRCRQWGFDIGGQSRYLAQRRLVQIATMGAITADQCAPLFEQWRCCFGAGFPVAPRLSASLATTN